MTSTLSRTLAEAGALWRRDRDVLVRIALPFILLPSLALQLLVPPLVAPVGTGLAEAFRLQSQFAGDHAGAYLLAAAAIEYGHAALYAYYLDPRAADVRATLMRAAVTWPRFALLAIVVAIVTLGGLLFPLAGRLLPAGGALVAGRRVSAVGAAGRAFRMTAGRTLATGALAAGLLGARLLLLWPFAGLDAWLRSLGEANPVALAIVDAAGAGVTTLIAIAGVLVAVVLYRSLAGDGDAGGGRAGASIGT
jgi:hypothetical protein